MNNPREQIWAYLHNELTAEQRTRFEEALESDKVLRKAVEERQETNRVLENTLPHLDAEENNRPFVDHLLEQWEAEHPEYQEPAVYSRGKIIRMTFPLAAAAAAMVVLLASPLGKGPIQWQRTTYGTSLQIRGEAEIESRYDRSKLKQVNHTLQETIESERSKHPSSPDRWMLSIQLQELVQGSLAIEVSGHPKSKPDHPSVWTATFLGEEDLRTNLPGFARQIAKDIAGQDSP
jgi:hypothetical protein